MASSELQISPSDFMKKVCELYEEARHPKIRLQNISRGTSRVVSFEVEDLTAAFLATNLGTDYKFLIAQKMKVEAMSSFEPDVVVIKGNQIHDIIDVKMDLGRRRSDFFEEGEKWRDRLTQLKGMECSFIDGVSKERQFSSFASSVKCHMVVISAGNISSEQLQYQVSKYDNYDTVELYVLSENLHPNTYHKTPSEIIEIMNVRDDEFHRLLDYIT